MTFNSKRIWHYVKWAFGSLMIVFIGIVGVFYYLVATDNEQIPALICQIAKKELDIEMAFSHIKTNRISNFPYLTLEVGDIYIKGSNHKTHKKDFFRAKKMTFLLPPWELVREQFSIQDVMVDSALIYFHKDSLGRNNTEFLKKMIKPNNPSQKPSKSKLKMEKITFHHVFFDIENEIKDQGFKVEFVDADLSIHPKSGFRNIQLDAQCHFGGLYFKKEKGGFLIDKTAELVLDIDIHPDQILFNNSLLTVDEDELKLSGYFTRADTNYLNLIIESDGILLANAQGLLPKSIQKTLGQFEIDQPITARFELDDVLIPGFPPSIHVDFATDSAQVKHKEFIIDQTKLEGNFSNDCFVTDRITPQSACLTIHDLEGKFLNKIPVKVSGRINDLKRLKNIEVAGRAQFPLKDLNEYLRDENRLHIVTGNAELEFNFKGNPKALAEKDSLAFRGLGARMQLNNLNLKLNNKPLPLKVSRGTIQLENSGVKLQNMALKSARIEGMVNGQIDKILPFISNEKERLAADLIIDFKKMDLDDFLKSLPKSETSKRPKDTLLGNQLATIINQVTNLADADVQLNIQNFEYENIHGKGIELGLKTTKECVVEGLDDSTACLQVTDFQANILEGIKAKGGFSISNMADPRLDIEMVLTAPATKLIELGNNEQFSVTEGQIELDAIANIYLNDYEQIDKLLERLIFSSTLKTKDLNVFYQPQELAIKGLNSNIHLNQDTFLIDEFTFEYENFAPLLKGNITNFLPLLFGKEQTANIDLDVLIPKVIIEDSTETKSDSTFSPRAMIAQLDTVFNILVGQIGVTIPELELPDYPIENLSFLIHFDNSCDPENDATNCIGIKDFQADVFGDIPIEGDVQIKDLQDPSLTVSLKTLMPMQDLNREMKNDDFIGNGGEVSLKLDYKVSISDELTVKKYLLDSELQAQVEFREVDLYYPARDYEFTSLNSQIRFNQKDLEIDTWSMKVNGNAIDMKGDCPDFLPYFFNDGKMLHIHGELNSPSFDFGDFNTPRTVSQKVKVTPKEGEMKGRIHEISHLLEESYISFTTKIEQLKYESFLGNQVIGEIRLGKDSLVLDHLTMQLASGEFGVNGVITNIAAHHPFVEVDTYFSGTNIDEVFDGFQNFGQSSLTHENVKGKLFADMSFKADLNDHYEVDPESIDGNVRLRVSDGELIDFPALENLTGFLFKKRQLNDIYFDTLLTHLKFDGLDLVINNFNIHSTAATLSIDGLYTFGKQDKTHVFFEVPLSNLFKRHIHRDLIKQHYSKRSGLPILVEAKEEGKKLNFKLKLFKRK
ncbi:MAG: AsmA-like C-terminal region-containing protein [Saprospiraceae bacterium]|nr:AsmA-like C-terminal region-containing protein [Saprospiraceae bacterium]